MTLQSQIAEVTDVGFIDIAKSMLEELDLIDSDKLDEAYILSLSAVFGEKILLGAVDLVQKNRVSKLKCPSGRVLYEVNDGIASFKIFSRSNFCHCPEFSTKVIQQNTQILCKHILAARIADALKKYRQRDITDKQMSDILIEIMSQDEDICS